MPSSSPKKPTASSGHDTSTPEAVSLSAPGTTFTPGVAAASTVTAPIVNVEPVHNVRKEASAPPAHSPSSTASIQRRPQNQATPPHSSPSPPVITANQPSAAISACVAGSASTVPRSVTWYGARGVSPDQSSPAATPRVASVRTVTAKARTSLVTPFPLACTAESARWYPPVRLIS